MDKQGQIAFDFFGNSLEEQSPVNNARAQPEKTSLHSIPSITPERKLVPPTQVLFVEPGASDLESLKTTEVESSKLDLDTPEIETSKLNVFTREVEPKVMVSLNTPQVDSEELMISTPTPKVKPKEINLVSSQTSEPSEEIIDFNIIKFDTTVVVDQDPSASKSTRGRKSIKSYDKDLDLPEIPANESDFTKQYYSIGEVALMFKVNASLLRFWETEFDIIQPRKNKKGDRHFRPVDIKNLELIYDLLRRRKLTIEGAKEYLKSNKRSREKYEMIKSLENLKSFLLEIKANL